MADPFKNSYKVDEKGIASLSVYNVGFQKCNPGYQWGPGVRDHFLIHYIVSGKGNYTCGEETFSLAAGDAFLVRPHQRVRYCADRQEPWEYYWVGFNGGDAARILSATDFSAGPILSGFADGDRLKKQLAAVSPFVDTVLVFIFEGLFSNPQSPAYTGYAPAGKYYEDYAAWLKEAHPDCLRSFG